MGRFLPMLFVADVEASSRWYQELFDLRSGHGGPEFEMLVVGDFDIVLQLHHLEGEEHGAVAAEERRGVGVLLYLQVDDVAAVHERAVAMRAVVESDPTWIDAAGHTEFVVRDPDGFGIAVHSARGQKPGGTS